jgi:hypothetical protein
VCSKTKTITETFADEEGFFVTREKVVTDSEASASEEAPPLKPHTSPAKLAKPTAVRLTSPSLVSYT